MNKDKKKPGAQPGNTNNPTGIPTSTIAVRVPVSLKNKAVKAAKPGKLGAWLSALIKKELAK